MKLFILTNHTASQQQLDDARLSLGVSEFVDLPVDLKTLWGNVPPDIESVTEYVTPLLCWLDSSLQNEDIVWRRVGELDCSFCNLDGFVVGGDATLFRESISD